MDINDNPNARFLYKQEYWMGGPCFQIEFYFRDKRCPLEDFSKTLLSNPMIFPAPDLPFFMSKDPPGRCILAMNKGEKPFGFVYHGGNHGDYDYYFLATYPPQVKRHCGDFHWSGRAEDPISTIDFHVELVSFIRRLQTQMNFDLALVSHEGAIGVAPSQAPLFGILIYDWLAQQGDFGASEYIEYGHALLPFEQTAT